MLLRVNYLSFLISIIMWRVQQALIIVIVVALRSFEEMLRPIGGWEVPINHCDDSDQGKHDTCVVEVLCSLMQILIKLKGQHKEAGGDKEPHD